MPGWRARSPSIGERFWIPGTGLPQHTANACFLVAPDEREADVRSQFARPSFSRVAGLDLRFLPYECTKPHRRRRRGGATASIYCASRERI